MPVLKQYSFFQLVQLLWFLFRTKLISTKARLIRFPIDIRGRKNILISTGFTTGVGCRLEAVNMDQKQVLVFGNNVQINDYVHITALKGVFIGNEVLIASKVYISDCSHGSYKGDANDTSPDISPSQRPLFAQPVIIKDRVWLGEFVSVLPGVTIGEGTIVGANSVVSRNLPSNVIAVGAPAKPIKKFNFKTKNWETI